MINIIKWLKIRREKSKCEVEVPSDWGVTKKYIARIASHDEPRQSFFGRQSLALFLEHGFNSAATGQLTEAERTGFEIAIASSEAGQSVDFSSLPDVNDKMAQESFRNWVFNIVRKDIPMPPQKDRDLHLISIAYSSINVLYDLKTIYNYYSPQSGVSKLHDLTEISQGTGRCLGELTPFIPSVATLITNGPVAFHDLLLTPCIMQDFAFNPDLYAVIISNRPMVFLSKKWWHFSTPSSSSFMDVGKTMPDFSEKATEIIAVARQQGGRVKSLYQP